MIKGCLYLAGGKRLATMRAKVDSERGGFAVSGHPFQCGPCKR